MAAALRLLLRRHAAPPPSPMLRSLFPAPYSKAAAAAAASLPAVRSAPFPPPRLREVTPRKAPPTPKDEPHCSKTVPSTMADSTNSLPDKLKDLKDSKKSLQNMERNIEEHEEMLRKVLHDREVGNTLLKKRLDDREKLLAQIEEDYEKMVLRGDYGKICKMQDDLAKVRKMRADFNKDLANQKAKALLFREQMEILREKRKDYLTALRRYHELERSTMELEPVENQEKGEPRCCKTVPSTMNDSTKSLLAKLKDLKDSKKSLKDMEKNIEEHTELVNKSLEDRKVVNASFRKRVDDLRELLDKMRNTNKPDDFRKLDAMYRRLEADYDKDWAIQEAKARSWGEEIDEQIEMLREKRKDYLTALRRYHELERSTMEQVEKVKKVAKVGAAIGLVGGLLLILAKI